MGNRKELKRLARSGRIVVKIGSSVLTDSAGRLEPKTLRRLSHEIAPLVGLRRWPYVVSSGAIAVGMGIMGLKTRPRTMAGLQAAAALGQSKLVEAWSQAFRKRDMPVAQVLLTHADLANRKRFLNARRALGELEKRRAISIINENDSVSFEEIAFGDNDELAAHVCNLVDAQILIMLSMTPGILDEQGNRVAEAVASDPRLDAVAKPSASRFGSGGMVSKLRSARTACARGAYVAILPGKEPGMIARLLDGEDVGTLLVPDQAGGTLNSRAHWIAHALRPAGAVLIDEGAAQAVINGNKSLLAPGILKVNGSFAEGDAIEIRRVGSKGPEPVARGLCRYSSQQLAKIVGLNSQQVRQVTEFNTSEAVVHRDDLVLVT